LRSPDQHDPEVSGSQALASNGDAAMGILSLLVMMCRRELLVAIRNPGQWLNPVLFFVVVVSLFPLGVGPSPATLALIAPGVLWVSALLAVMLSLDALYSSDFADGTLEQYVLSGQSLSLIVLAKVLVHWMLSGIPLLLLSPLLAMLLHLPGSAVGVLMLSLLIGSLTLSLIGSIGAALTLGLNQAGVLLSLLVLPLTVPVLIFGSAAVSAAASDLSATGQLWLLAALLALAASLAPLTAATALRNGVASNP